MRPDATPDPSARRPWTLRLALLVLAHLVGTLHIASMLAMSPLIAADLSLSATEVGLLMTAYNATKAAGALITGSITDRLGIGFSLLTAHLILALGAAAIAAADGYAQVIVGMLFMGAGYCFINPATAKGVMAWFPQERRATAMSAKQTGVPLGGFIGAFALALAGVIDWRDVMWIVVAVTLANGAVATIGADRPRWRRTAAERSQGGALALMRNRRLAAINASGATYNLAQQSFSTYLPLFLREAVLLSQSLTSVVLGATQIAAVAARLGLGAVADRWFRTSRTLLLALMGFAGAGAILALAIAGPAAGLLAALPLAILVGCSVVAYSGITLTAVVESVSPNQAGAAVGGHLFLAAIGAMAGPPIFGAIVDLSGSYTGGWAMACGALLLAATVFALLGRRRPA